MTRWKGATPSERRWLDHAAGIVRSWVRSGWRVASVSGDWGNVVIQLRYDDYPHRRLGFAVRFGWGPVTRSFLVVRLRERFKV